MTNRTSTQDVFQSLVEMAQAKSNLVSDIWHRSREEFGSVWVEQIVDSIVRLFGNESEGNWEQAIIGYGEFAIDSMRSQKYFESNGRYRWSTLDEIDNRYYRNEDHMMRRYLPGIYLSHYLWPHHYRLLRFFHDEVITRIEPAPAVFYDVGLGSGIYSRETMRAFPEARGIGFDISKHSIEFTRRVLQAYGVDNRYEFVKGNIFETKIPVGTGDFVVSQEVLEHVEDPKTFCEILYKLTKPDGHAYITAAVNAGLSDHIYLFRSPEEVQNLLEKCGWTILQTQTEYAYEGIPVDITPCVAAFFCER